MTSHSLETPSARCAPPSRLCRSRCYSWKEFRSQLANVLDSALADGCATPLLQTPNLHVLEGSSQNVSAFTLPSWEHVERCSDGCGTPSCRTQTVESSRFKLRTRSRSAMIGLH